MPPVQTPQLLVVTMRSMPLHRAREVSAVRFWRPVGWVRTTDVLAAHGTKPCAGRAWQSDTNYVCEYMGRGSVAQGMVEKECVMRGEGYRRQMVVEVRVDDVKLRKESHVCKPC